MHEKIHLISDYFYEDFTGGAELNVFSLLERFSEVGIEVSKSRCSETTISDLEGKNVIVSNFVTLSEKVKAYLMSGHSNYVIYEHDHKYLKTRNPIFYPDFQAPESELANFKFYKNAKSVICLTNLAVDVFKKNTGLENVKKVGASVWRDQDLDYIQTLAGKEKNNKFAVVESQNPIKKTRQCVEYCTNNNIDSELRSDKDNRKVLKK